MKKAFASHDEFKSLLSSARPFVLQSLQAILEKNIHCDKALAAVFKQHKIKDKEPVVYAVHDILRQWRFLWACRGQEPATNSASLQNVLKTWERLQGLAAKEGNECASLQNQADSLDQVALSVPAWLYDLGFAESGEDWRNDLAAMNRPAERVVRVNTLKIDRSHCAEYFSRSSIIPWAPHALWLHDPIDLYATKAFRQGWVEVQDPASQAVTALLQVEPGQRVVDACAGAGGKSLYLAALMQNKGRIIALDPSVPRLAELRRRARRAGVFIIEARPIESMKTIKRLYDSADRLLLDVPCSGTGVLRRNPDLRWRLTPAMLDQLIAQQQQILHHYSRMVKPDGLILYTTCSLLKAEGEAQISRFLESHADAFSLLKEKRYSPSLDGFDGFYAAVLKREVGCL
ncbi:MAG TPA: RsmB/NOP family class I SAM-dependent RNA methyltransferase [bacterium]|nr:RsmB/NOP family class I SAM-dependent RNA methyltransferase [bacterium]HPN34540.1 RsmB/NOP family class I SAM-dependent RNA methyltransferase [bacterium]